jgi:hypothetical protein
VVGVGPISCKHVGLADEQLLFLVGEPIPTLQEVPPLTRSVI